MDFKARHVLFSRRRGVYSERGERIWRKAIEMNLVKNSGCRWSCSW